jgi:NAD-dependent dihydropyrimidine dehydrogenase PreA subunit
MVDIFLIFEETKSVNGKEAPLGRKDLCEFMEMRRQPFIHCYHIVAVHPAAQVYITQDLHKTVHGGLLRPGIQPFLNAILKNGFQHVYYSASTSKHACEFMCILNGQAVTQLKTFEEIDFNIVTNKLRSSIIGQRGNLQHTWGVASMNLKQTVPGDLVTHATVKPEMCLMAFYLSSSTCPSYCLR